MSKTDSLQLTDKGKNQALGKNVIPKQAIRSKRTATVKNMEE